MIDPNAEQAMNDSLDRLGWTRLGKMHTIEDGTGGQVAVVAAGKTAAVPGVVLVGSSAPNDDETLVRTLIVLNFQEALNLARGVLLAAFEVTP